MKPLPVALLSVAIVFGVSIAQPAFAWGATGHRIIGRLAIRSLPAELPAFLKSPETLWQVGELAREPDRWKGTDVAHDAELNAGHFVDVGNDGKIAGVVALNALPKTRDDYDTALRAGNSTQYKEGYLPYAIIIGFQQLRTDFGTWRVDVAGAKFAKSAAARAWFTADRKLHELTIRRDLGVWAHFVGDASQPMHVSVHHDGWGNFPNPENFTVPAGIHAKFEGSFVRANFHEADVLPLMAPAHACACQIETETMAYLAKDLAKLIPLYRLDKTGGFDGVGSQGRAFVGERLAAGAAELRDLITEAWTQSGTISVGYPAIAVRDVESGRIDAKTALGSLQGLD